MTDRQQPGNDISEIYGGPGEETGVAGVAHGCEPERAAELRA
jgi:hypothetical protein